MRRAGDTEADSSVDLAQKDPPRKLSPPPVSLHHPPSLPPTLPEGARDSRPWAGGSPQAKEAPAFQAARELPGQCWLTTSRCWGHCPLQERPVAPPSSLGSTGAKGWAAGLRVPVSVSLQRRPAKPSGQRQ